MATIMFVLMIVSLLLILALDTRQKFHPQIQEMNGHSRLPRR